MASRRSYPSEGPSVPLHMRESMGGKLRDARTKEKHLRLDEVADRLGISTGYLSQLERGLEPSPRLGAPIGASESVRHSVPRAPARRLPEHHSRIPRLVKVIGMARRPARRPVYPFGLFAQAVEPGEVRRPCPGPADCPGRSVIARTLSAPSPSPPTWRPAQSGRCTSGRPREDSRRRSLSPPPYSLSSPLPTRLAPVLCWPLGQLSRPRR
jgi:hypothetical protein